MKKRLLSTLLALCLALTLMPPPTASAVYAVGNEGEGEKESTIAAAIMPSSVTVTAVSAAAHLTLQELKEKYPAGSRWTGSFDGSIQCAGFSRLLCYEAYGSEYYTNNSDGKWKKYTDSSYIDNSLKAGDLIRYKPGRYGHSVFVVGVSGNDVSIADCNFDLNDSVRWTTVTKSALKVGFTHAYSAPYVLAGAAAATVQPEITLSQSSVSLQLGGSATVTIGTKSPGAIYLKGHTSDASVCGGSLGSWNSTGTEKPLTLNGNGLGTATVTIYMYDGKTNAELTRKTIAVTVIPVPIAPPASTSVQQPGVVVLNTLNSTGDASLYPTVFKGYLRDTSKYDAYSDSSGTEHIGRIYANDELKVQSVYANNGALWMSALCPWDGYSSDRLIYAKLDAMLDTGFAPYKAIATSSAAVYTRADAAAKYGSLGKGDAITVVGQSGQYSQVIYPLAAGGYKIGWCQTSCLSRPNISNIIADSSTTIKISCALASNAANNLVILDANRNFLVRGSISGNNNVTVRNMTRGATYYIYIESVLSNGTGTVLSAVNKVTMK